MKPTFDTLEEFVEHAFANYRNGWFTGKDYFIITLAKAEEAGYIQRTECIGSYELTKKGLDLS